MTIDEAISEFKKRAEDSKKNSELGMKSYIPKEKEEKELAEWLEELKSYRASVFSGDMTQKMLKEEYCKAVDDFAESVKNLIIDLSVIRFKDIDEIAEQLKVGDGGFDNTDCELGQAFNIAIKALEELQQYRAIGTPEECRAAMEKQAEKKVLHNEKAKRYFCPICERKCNYMHSLYCSGCGQKLDWSDEE